MWSSNKQFKTQIPLYSALDKSKQHKILEMSHILINNRLKLDFGSKYSFSKQNCFNIFAIKLILILIQLNPPRENEN